MKRKTIQYHITSAQHLADKKVEKMARAILKKHKHLKEFVMAMGSYFFVDQNDDIVTTTQQIESNGNFVKIDSFKYFKPLNDFMREWDNTLHITGGAMRFTATGKKITHW